MGTIFIKYSKVNQVRYLFDIGKISHYSMKTCYALSILYYGLIVLCPHMQSVPPPRLFSIYTVHLPLHIIRLPSYILSVPPLTYCLSPPLTYCSSPSLTYCPSPLLHTVCPPLLHTVCPPSYILFVPPLTYCSFPIN